MSKIHLEIEIPGNAKTYEFVLDDPAVAAGGAVVSRSIS